MAITIQSEYAGGKFNFRSFISALAHATVRVQRPPPLPSHVLWYYTNNSLPFEPEKWNVSRTRRLSNCYAYAINIPINNVMNFAPQPGQTGLPFLKYLLSQFIVTKKILIEAANADGLIPHDLARPVPSGYYLAALLYRPGLLFGDYHWYRLDHNKDGHYVWTHKPGAGAATDRDYSGDIIYDLSKADLGIFKPRWGGYFIVPRRRISQPADVSLASCPLSGGNPA